MKEISQELIDRFYNQGFFTLNNLFGLKELELLKSEADKIYQQALQTGPTENLHGARIVYSATSVQRIVWCGALSKILLNVGTDTRITEPVANLLKSSTIIQIINQLHFKMPSDGVSFPFHQDSQHRRYGTDQWTDINGLGSYVQTVLTLDDMTEENGPLVFIPQSCQQGHLDMSHDYQPDEKKALTLTAKAGSLIFFGPYTIHGSKANNSSSPRRVLINGYAYPGANKKVYPGCGTGRIIELKA